MHRPLLASLLFALSGCTGTIDEPGDLEGVGPIGEIMRENTEQDDMLQEENPDLFMRIRDHFPSAQAGLGPARVARLTRRQLDNTVAALLPGHADAISAEASIPGDPLQTGYEYADNLRITSSNFGSLEDWAAGIGDSVRADPASVIDCDAGDAACQEREARAFVERAFRGVAPPEALDAHAMFYAMNVADAGFADATAELVVTTLTSPRFVFREEVVTDEAGLLLPPQALQHLTYTLADEPPFALLSSADPGRLETPEGRAEVVDEVLASPAARQKLLRFFSAWLEIREADTFQISAEVFPEFTPEVAGAVVQETNDFLAAQLAGASPSLGGVLFATESNVPDAMAFIYGLDSGGVVQLDTEQRLGVLSMPAFIASHSGPVHTRLVKRGVFFTRKVMCVALGAPPEDADTSLPEIEDATERERVEVATESGTCAGCHNYINPFGFALESYDPIGRFRIVDEEGHDIDPSLDVDFLEEGRLQSATSVEALRGFTESLLFQQCFTRQLFRYYMARVEAPQDDPLLRHMLFRFLSDGDGNHDIVQMLRQLANSAHFSRRGEESL